ncbi:hypothetical protein [Mycobacterium avium]|uniref:hypothetical protein n=1 Tax=Mycobacterium avium TaxID=1764 RepID=UPI001E381460|nr:hypothetical protein [Mycobacterium avium]
MIAALSQMVDGHRRQQPLEDLSEQRLHRNSSVKYYHTDLGQHTISGTNLKGEPATLKFPKTILISLVTVYSTSS